MTIRVRLLLGFTMVSLALVAAPLTMYIVQSSRALQAANQKHVGIPPSKVLLRMVRLLQQHRGLSAGVLGGNTSMDAQRAAKQIEVDKAVEAFTAVAAAEIRDPELIVTWRRTLEPWWGLAHNVSSRSTTGQQSFAEHTALIADSLKLLDLMLDYFGLSYDPTGNDYHLTMALLVHMPQLTEFLGQARARGTVHLAQKNITPADRTTLIGLISNVERQHELMARELGKAVAMNPGLKTDLGGIARDSMVLAQQASDLARTKVVEVERLSYPPNEYFSAFTKAIDGQFALLDKATVDLEGALEARIAELRSRENKTIGSMALVIAFAVWLATLIIRATKQDIVALQQSEEAQRRHASELEATVEDRTRELRAVNVQLEAASRHKSEFLAHMSHELRTPLNAILGFSELLHNPIFGPLNEKQARYLGHIYSSGKHLLDLISGLLDLAKVEAGKLELHSEPFALHEALAAAIADVQPMVDQKRLTLTLHPSAPMTLSADPIRFKQIIYNLLSNAIKFTPEGGRITVTAHTGARGEELGDGDFVEIVVADTGIGMTAEEMRKLFQPFTQLHPTLARQHHGTGLGLALTKQLVELHGGQIWAASESADRGSTFTVRFPLAPRARPAIEGR